MKYEWKLAVAKRYSAAPKRSRAARSDFGNERQLQRRMVLRYLWRNANDVLEVLVNSSLDRQRLSSTDGTNRMT
jgi:hypothetical protein